MSVKWMFPHTNKRAAYTFSMLVERLGLNLLHAVDPGNSGSADILIAWGHITEFDQLPENANVLILHNSHTLDQLERAENQASSIQIDQTNIPVLSTKARAPKKNWVKSKTDSVYRHKNNNWYFIPFDIPVNIFYHLSRFEERSRHFSDEQPSDHQKSILWHNGKLLNPVVDVLVDAVNKVLSECADKAGIPLVRLWPWPNGEDWAAALTHDVDLTRGLSFIDHGKALGKNILVRLAGKMENAQKLASETREKSQRFWTFTDLQALYYKSGISATFFFIAKTLEGLHLRYYTGSDRFRRLFTQLKVNGHEIGLHTSLKAFDNPENYVQQRNRLNTHATSSVKGMRQHYLRCRFPRLWKLAEMADLKYDSSLGYNYAAGFRAGTVSPFATFDLSADCQRKVTEFPLMFFENNLPDNDHESQITAIISEVEKHHGLLTALLHPSSYADEKWKKTWQNLTERIAKSGAWTASLEDHQFWLQQRSTIQISQKQTAEKSWEITVTKPSHLKRFTLRLPAYKEFQARSKVKLSFVDPRRAVISGKQKTIKLRLQQ